MFIFSELLTTSITGLNPTRRFGGGEGDAPIISEEGAGGEAVDRVENRPPSQLSLALFLAVIRGISSPVLLVSSAGVGDVCFPSLSSSGGGDPSVMKD